jgi:hypothetical protein
VENRRKAGPPSIFFVFPFPVVVEPGNAMALALALARGPLGRPGGGSGDRQHCGGGPYTPPPWPNCCIGRTGAPVEHWSWRVGARKAVGGRRTDHLAVEPNRAMQSNLYETK